MAFRRAVAYVRASTSKQKLSCDDQLAAVETYCARENLTLARVFRDDGISGTRGRAGRAGWNALLDYVESGQLTGGVVVVWSVDRWSRDFRAGLEATWVVGDYDVELHTTDRGRVDLSTLDGQIRAAIESAIAEKESRERSRRVRERKREHASKGFWVNHAPYGYRVVGERGRKALVANPATASVLLEIYERYDQGESCGQIARALNRRAVPTLRGGAWTPATVRYILGNPTYLGLVPSEAGRLPGMVEIIVPADVAQRCHERAAIRRGSAGRHTKHPLTGLVICASCSQSMYVHTWTTYSGGRRRVYRCRGRVDGTCASTALVDVSGLEEAVVGWWRALCDSEAIDTLAREVVSQEHAEALRAQEARRPLVDHLAELERREQNLVDAIAETGLSPVIRRRLDEVRAQRCEVEAELTAAGGDVEPDDIDAAVERLREAVRSAATPAALRPYIDQIVVSPDRAIAIEGFGVHVRISG